MPNRSDNWFAQAIRDPEQALASQSEDLHEWARFATHQSSEKVIKALHLALGQEAWGHVIAQLLVELPSSMPQYLLNKVKEGDNFDIPTRYPNSHPEGASFGHYRPLQSERAIRYAGEIFEFVRAQMA